MDGWGTDDDAVEDVLSQYEGADLELFYLVQTGKKDNATFTLHATSDVNNSLVAGERLQIVYEK